jgi:excisionase family DNA binding protein
MDNDTATHQMQRPAEPEPIFDPERDKLYSTTRVAEIFDVSNETVRDWIKAGKLNAIRLGSNRLRVTDREIKRFASHRFNPSTDQVTDA